MRSRIRKLASNFSCNLILERKFALLNIHIDISILVVYMKELKEEKKKLSEVSQSQNKKSSY